MDTPTATDRPVAELDPTQLFNVGKAGADTMLELQKELFDAYEEAGQVWIERVKSECDLWSTLAARLSEARTLPDGLSACQHSFSERIKLAAEDGQRWISEGQKIAGAMTHSLSSTWLQANGNKAARN